MTTIGVFWDALPKGLSMRIFGDFLRVQAFAVAEDSRTLEVVDVSDDGAVAAHALFDLFSHFIRVQPGRRRCIYQKAASCR